MPGCVTIAAPMSPASDRRAGEKPRLLFLVTEDWYFWSHRVDLARAARDAGYEVLVATRVHDYRKRIEDEGFILLPLDWKRGGTNPIQELRSFWALVSLYRRERPALVCHVSLKPVLYGTWAARLAGISAVVNSVTGLGWAAGIETWRAAGLRFFLVRFLKRTLAFSKAYSVFQNPEDAAELHDGPIGPRSKALIIRGSGVNTERFRPSPESPGLPVVLLAARMLWSKGVGEFIRAIRLLQDRGVRARYVLAGMIDTENPGHIPESQLRRWQEQGVIEWWGYQDDMPQVMEKSHLVVLPTYYGEGLPKVLLEAAACARPLIATRMRGCSDIVRDGDNGLLVPPRDPEALAEAIAKLVLDPQLRARLGAKGRELVMHQFASRRIVEENLSLYREILRPGTCSTETDCICGESFALQGMDQVASVERGGDRATVE